MEIIREKQRIHAITKAVSKPAKLDNNKTADVL